MLLNTFPFIQSSCWTSCKGHPYLSVANGKRGLGELICLKFAAEGCNIVINYVSAEDRAVNLKRKIFETYNVKVEIVQGDVGLESDCQRIVAESIHKLGGLDIIISNAGYTRFSDFNDLSAPTIEDWDKTYAVNVKAQVHLMNAALPTFKKNVEGGGSV